MSPDRPRGEAPPETAGKPGGGHGHTLRPVLVFAGILAGLFVALRLLHLALPLLYPPVLAGPFSLDDLGEVERYTGFEPLVPFYRPEVLGSGPVTITARRRPLPQVLIFWQGRRFLYLAERRGGPQPRTSPDARPLPAHPEALWWREGRTHRVVWPLDGLWIEIRTDLPEQDLHRLVETLRPYGELL